MATKMSAGNFTKAEPWKEGRVVVGYFRGVEDVPGCDSRKVSFSPTGSPEDEVAVWETAALRLFVAKMKPDLYYRVTCIGQQKFGKGMGWAFEVEYLDENEIAAAMRAAANKDKPAAK